jgi:hypothetical protein
MSMFLPESDKQAQTQDGVSSSAPDVIQTTQADVAIMQRVFSAAAQNPTQIPDSFMAYFLDWLQINKLQIPIDQVFGYKTSVNAIVDEAVPHVVTVLPSSPFDGQMVLFKCGTTPFVYVQMIYDQSFGHWISPEFPLGGGICSSGVGGGLSGGLAGISWDPVTAGLTMQAKWSGVGQNDAGAFTTGMRIYFLWGLFSSAITSGTMSSQTFTADGANHPIGQDWANVSNPGAYTLAAVGLQCFTSGGTNNSSGAAVGRYIA